MKFEKQQNIFIVLIFFIFVNIILLKIISINTIDDSEITDRAKNLTILDTHTLSLVQSNKDLSNKSIKILIENITDSVNSTNSNQTYPTNKNQSNNDKTDVVSEVGKNIGDGLKPIIIPNNLLQIDHDSIEHKTISMRNIFTLLGLILIISSIFIGYLYYTNKQFRNRENDNYHLLTD